MNRQEAVEKFQKRLSEVIERSGLSRSAFAAQLGLDRSTLSQLLSAGNDRLPRAETIVAIASMAQVSVDWLLGLSEDEESSELVASELEIESNAGLPMDERLQRWHAEAVGYKIRYVPTTLPDLLKSKEVIGYEYQEYGDPVHEARIEEAERRLAYSRRPETDIEACSSYHSLDTFAYGEGIWRNLPLEDRIAQLDWMVELTEELYPTFRWFLYDGLQRFSVPYTIFGPTRVAVYVGSSFFVFNATEQIRALTRHFDDLIRAAVVQPPDVADYLKGLRRKVAGGKAKAAQSGAKAKATSK